MPRREKPHPDWLLCERCGYRLEGIDPAPGAPCPECGTPIDESLPARRTGSAWQRKPGFRAWLNTNWTTLRHPWTRWDEVRPIPAGGLLVLNTCVVAFVHALLVGDITFRGEGELDLAVISWIFSAVLLTGPIWIALLLLTHAEGIGLRVLGARNKWRTTGAVSGAIIAHASIGWLLAVPVLLAQIVYFRTMPPMSAFGWTWWSLAVAWAVAPLAGLVGFELLAWLGWRRMKFANRMASNPKDGV